MLYKDYKIGKINTELEITLKRILRLLQKDDERTKDFEYYLKHFKLKKLDTVFLRSEQTVSDNLDKAFPLSNEER